MFKIQYEFSMRWRRLARLELNSLNFSPSIAIEKDILQARLENYEAEQDLMDHFFN